CDWPGHRAHASQQIHCRRREGVGRPEEKGRLSITGRRQEFAVASQSLQERATNSSQQVFNLAGWLVSKFEPLFVGPGRWRGSFKRGASSCEESTRSPSQRIAKLVPAKRI